MGDDSIPALVTNALRKMAKHATCTILEHPVKSSLFKIFVHIKKFSRCVSFKFFAVRLNSLWVYVLPEKRLCKHGDVARRAHILPVFEPIFF